VAAVLAAAEVSVAAAASAADNPHVRLFHSQRGHLQQAARARAFWERALSSHVRRNPWVNSLLSRTAATRNRTRRDERKLTMTMQRPCSASRTGRMGGTRACAAVLLAALALGGCQTVTGSPTTEAEDNQLAASPTNIASLTAVVQRNPSDPQAYNMRGSVFGQAGRNDEALADFNKAISLDPNYSQAYANRGLIYRKTGKLDLALTDYNKALTLDPSYAVAFLGRGVVHRLRKQPLEAFNDFNKAIAIRPDNTEAYYNRGLLYQSQKQHQYAIDDFSTAIGLSQNQAEPFIARGLSYMAINDFKAAAADLDDAVSAEPQNLRAWMTRAFAYEKLGDKEKAAGSYARALNINKDHEAAKQGFARVGGKMGQTYQTF
jgi:tetratricopeptide (TPR) repeat protein